MTEIEQGYEDQGYRLPDGWTWERVAEERAKWGVGEIYVPICAGPGCMGWGVPMIGHRFMTHEKLIIARAAVQSN